MAGARSRWKGARAELRDLLGCLIFYECIAKSTNHRILVRVRNDRVKLVSLYEQGKQILQITASSFPTLEEACSFMKGIAVKFAAGDLRKDQLVPWKNEHMPLRPVRKRPGSKSHNEASVKKQPRDANDDGGEGEAREIPDTAEDEAVQEGEDEEEAEAAEPKGMQVASYKHPNSLCIRLPQFV